MKQRLVAYVWCVAAISSGSLMAKTELSPHEIVRARVQEIISDQEVQKSAQQAFLANVQCAHVVLKKYAAIAPLHEKKFVVRIVDLLESVVQDMLLQAEKGIEAFTQDQYDSYVQKIQVVHMLAQELQMIIMRAVPNPDELRGYAAIFCGGLQVALSTARLELQA